MLLRLDDLAECRENAVSQAHAVVNAMSCPARRLITGRRTPVARPHPSRFTDHPCRWAEDSLSGKPGISAFM